MPLSANSQAPDFSLPSTSGSSFTLSKSAANQAIILYFYPKDFTRVCTKEACEFRDNFSVFKNLDVPVIGISRDSVETHLKFKKEFNLPFELLADENGKVAQLYKAAIPVIGLNRRVTYLLDKNHQIVKVFEKMFGSSEHVQEMINSLK
jgi:peroxiredoxin Q/BCP